MEIRVRTKDGKVFRARAYKIKDGMIELPHPEIFNYDKHAFVRLAQDFVIIPFSSIYMMKGNIRSRQWKKIW